MSGCKVVSLNATSRKKEKHEKTANLAVIYSFETKKKEVAFEITKKNLKLAALNLDW